MTIDNLFSGSLFVRFTTTTAESVLLGQLSHAIHDLLQKINLCYQKRVKTKVYRTSSLDGAARPDLESNQKVTISPLPFTVILPLSLVT